MLRSVAAASLGAVAAADVSIPTREILPGVNMPIVSIGTGGSETNETVLIVANWLSLGGRGIDAAYAYHNQDVVAEAIAQSGVDRKELFITSKIPKCVENAADYIEDDLQQLGTDYLDLMLIHMPNGGHCDVAWAQFEDYHQRGVLRAIGVSHFERSDIESLLKTAKVVPHVNQILLNVLNHDDDMLAASEEHNITLMAYSPLGKGNHMHGDPANVPEVVAIAEARNVSKYQVALRWVLQHDSMLAFQSSKREHQEVDADIFSFELTDDEMATLDGVQHQLLEIV